MAIALRCLLMEILSWVTHILILYLSCSILIYKRILAFKAQIFTLIFHTIVITQNNIFQLCLIIDFWIFFCSLTLLHAIRPLFLRFLCSLSKNVENNHKCTSLSCPLSWYPRTETQQICNFFLLQEIVLANDS